jgi:Zn-dependent peptidase ImmA (M78 family)/transcriptional regulator with XRE-family HTH domain
VRDQERQLGLPGVAHGELASLVNHGFDPARLTQARLLAGLTKADLAAEMHLSAAAIGQFEAGLSTPRAEHLPRLAATLNVPVGFFAAGRPYARVDAGVAHFRSLRSTRVRERAKAIAYVEQVWELTNALERYVELPELDLPKVSEKTADPAAAASAARAHWNLPPGPIPHLVRTMETRGIIVTLLPLSRGEAARIDAFSTSQLPRPVVVLTPDRADNVYRHRFTAAHELGHLLLHHEIATGDQQREREANAFAAEFLTPANEIKAELQPRLRIHELAELSRCWGISIKSLITRCRELGVTSESSARRAYQRLNEIQSAGLVPDEPVAAYPGEMPCLLSRAYDLAEQSGLTVPRLGDELAWATARVRELLGREGTRPTLRLV